MSTLGQRSDAGEFRKRFKWHALFVVAAFLVLAGRLFFLQVIRADAYQAEARENIIRRTTLATTRGVVRDSLGRVLASNRPAYNVYLVPEVKIARKMVCITETDGWRKLVDYLQMSADERSRVEKKLAEICGEPRNYPRARKFQQFLLREDVGRDVVATLETHAGELKGVDVVPVPVRFYPYGELSAHLLGYMAEVDAELLSRLRASGYIEGDRVGAAGVERGWESYLRGVRGWEKVVVDARNQRRSGGDAERLLDEPKRLDPVPGRDLRLSLDIELIEALDKSMRGQIAGAAVVVDVRTGRVLALYSKPSFDPNILSGGSGKQAIRDAFRRLYTDPLMPTLDKTMSGSYPPGSTYKPFSAFAALEPPDPDQKGQRGILDPKARVNCRGFINYGKRLFRCTHVHGPVDMRQAIVQSCNVYFYELADKVGLDALAKWGLLYGFGAKTGIGANPESAGRIPTYSWYATHYKGQFRGGFTLNAAIGQGATTVSVLQLALAYGALANGGTLYQPQLVRAVETSDGAVVQEFAPRVKRRIQVRPENWRLVVDGLHGVVNEAEGTAYHERLPDVDMSGKTGTAQTSHRGVHGEDASRVWYFNRDHAWFAGFSPAKAPEIAVAVLIEHGGAGGKNAAPVAFAAARAYQKLATERAAEKSAPPPPPKPPAPGGGKPHRGKGKRLAVLSEKIQGTAEHVDWPLFIAAMVIAAIGVINLYSATSVYTQARADLYVSQVYFLVAGGALAVFVVAIDYRHIERWAYVLYILGVLSLILVLALGKDIRGSSRWINIGSFGFQPSEFMKLFLTVALAKYFHEAPRTDQPKALKDMIVPAILAGVPFVLVLRQPDLGTALILGLIFVSIAALSRIRWQSMVGLIATIGIALPLAYSRLEAYQLKRIESFLNPESDVTGAGYHAHHARIAIGNGGVFGQGYMKGSQNQYYFLPDQYTDFPFPVLAEDWGFVGSVVLLCVYAFLVLWAIRIAALAKDRFGAVTAIGIGGMIFWHAFFNLGMVTGILPVVGVTLPLFSYGGSSVLTILLGLGLLMNISMRRPYLTPVRTERVVFAR